MSLRRPQPAVPPRIAPLATLPLFHKLSGRKTVVAGDSDGAVWKAELLAATGADVHVFAPKQPDAFAALAALPPAGRVIVLDRAWTPDDLANTSLAVADVESAEEAAAFAAAAHAAGAIVNIVDKPAFCDVQFGAIVNRSPLLVAISTDGAAPVFGQAIRARIEAMLAPGLTAWAQAARDWRPLVQARNLSFAARRRFWERFTARALDASEQAPDDEDCRALIAGLDRADASPPPGRVTLVGAGPGDPELLTLKAMRVLQSADIILYDDLVSAQVLELARREAKRMLVGKTGHGPSCRQSDIDVLMVRLARQGLHVVRLKSGDPLIFGRAAEEIQACEAAGIAVEIVPGVTAAQGAAASLKVSLTERRSARRVQFVTGHGMDGDLPGDISWDAIADTGATTVIYMPRRTLEAFAERALAAGLAPDTPAVAVQSATRAQEHRIIGTMASLPGQVSAAPASGPLLVIVGAALKSFIRTAGFTPATEDETVVSGQHHAISGSKYISL